MTDSLQEGTLDVSTATTLDHLLDLLHSLDLSSDRGKILAKPAFEKALPLVTTLSDSLELFDAVESIEEESSVAFAKAIAFAKNMDDIRAICDYIALRYDLFDCRRELSLVFVRAEEFEERSRT